MSGKTIYAAQRIFTWVMPANYCLKFRILRDEEASVYIGIRQMTIKQLTSAMPLDMAAIADGEPVELHDSGYALVSKNGRIAIHHEGRIVSEKNGDLARVLAFAMGR